MSAAPALGEQIFLTTQSGKSKSRQARKRENAFNDHPVVGVEEHVSEAELTVVGMHMIGGVLHDGLVVSYAPCCPSASYMTRRMTSYWTPINRCSSACT